MNRRNILRYGLSLAAASPLGGAEVAVVAQTATGPVPQSPGYYANLKAFGEWGARNRPEGWSFWLSVDIPL